MSKSDSKIKREHVPVLVDAFLEKYKLKGLHAIICGSYRRGLPESNDIDIVIVKESYEHTNALFNGLMAAFGPQRSALILPRSYGVFEGRKFDVKIAEPRFLGSMLLHATGCWQFNRWMRWIAKTRELTLNQYGIFDEHVNQILTSEHEEDFFAFLDLPFIWPEDRNSEFYSVI